MVQQVKENKSVMNEAQKILNDMRGSDMLSLLACKYSQNPKLADNYLRELFSHTINNREYCEAVWVKHIVVRMRAYCEK